MNRASSCIWSSKKTKTGIERNIPWLRYRSMRSALRSRRKTRISTFGAPSTILARTGKFVTASPHQSSVSTRMFSFSFRFAKTALSSGRSFASAMFCRNFSLFVVIWSTYCWNVIPCSNRSLITIRSGLLCCLPHLGQVERGPEDLLLLDRVAHNQRHPAPGRYPLQRKDVDVLGQGASVLQAPRRPLVLREGGLHLPPVDPQHRLGPAGGGAPPAQGPRQEAGVPPSAG